VVVLALLLTSACSGGSLQATPPANIAGAYSVTLTNGDNGCQFTNFTGAPPTQDVHVTLQQQGATATGSVTGLAGLFFSIVLGTMAQQFQGTVSGDSFTLTAHGANAFHAGQCTFTIEATLSGTITGDTIQGQLVYTESTNGSPDCAYHATCSSTQSFAGARAPSADGG
jgi:hypothetical protein